MSRMPTTRLGNSQLEVSRLGLGSIPFGTDVSEQEARRSLDRFEAAGGTLIDTANIYGGGFRGTHEERAGTSERTVGRIIKGRRDRFLVATKGYWTMHHPIRPGGVGLSRRNLAEQLEASLRRLNVETIDLYQCHAYDFYTPVEETMEALDEFVQAGKIRCAGVSNWHGWGVAKANTLAALSGSAPVVSNQIWYNLADRGAEREIVPACRDQKVSIIAWGALAQGFLTGDYRRGDRGPTPGSGIAGSEETEPSSWRNLAVEKNWDLLELLERMAREHSRKLSTVALRWMLQAGQADVILLGGAQESHYAASLETLEFQLSDEEVRELTEASQPPLYYPNAFLDLFCLKESPLYGGLRPDGPAKT